MGLEDVDRFSNFSGHSFRRTAATIMADGGASGQTLRNKLNHVSEKSVNEYISSSKAVQKSNANLLSGHKKEKSAAKPEELTDETKVVKEKEIEATKDVSSLFLNSHVKFENCTVSFK